MLLIFTLACSNTSDRSFEPEPITQLSTEPEINAPCDCPEITRLKIKGHNDYLCCDNDFKNHITAYDLNCEWEVSSSWSWIWEAKENCTILSDGGPSATVTPITCADNAEAVFTVNLISNTSGCKFAAKGKIFHLSIKGGEDCF